MKYKFLALPFLVGLISAIKINFIGELRVGEVMAGVYVIINFSKLRITKQEKNIIVFAFVWAIAQLCSDLFNKTEIRDALKGIFAPIVFVNSFIFLLTYAKNGFQRLPSLLLGVTVGGLGQLILFPTEYFLSNFWKWGVGNALLGLFVIYFSFFLKTKRNSMLLTAIFLFFGISLYFDSRGLAILPIFAALAYIRYYGKRASNVSKFFSSAWASFKVLLVAFPVLILINSAASALFTSETLLSNFSIDAAGKYRTQATGTFGILLGGRSETLVSIQAFWDKPLLGHGSWAKDNSGYGDQLSTLRSKLGYSLIEGGGYEESDFLLIPTHSYLMGALVWAGAFGGLFWLVILNSSLKIFIKNLNLLPLYYYVGMVGLIWNIFFSPFGAESRWITAVFLAAFYSYPTHRKITERVTA